MGREPASHRSLQLDGAVERNVDVGDRQAHVRGEAVAVLDRAAFHALRDRALDLALRADADHLQELADAQVERLFVHGASPIAMTTLAFYVRCSKAADAPGNERAATGAPRSKRQVRIAASRSIATPISRT